MPPAFNLSQDQTLQFKPVTVFGLFRTRSLTQRTDEVFNHLSMTKPSFHYCVRLDTFASRPAPEKTPQPGARRASSAHTYRLLVFKDRFAHFTAPISTTPALLRSASLHQQQRSEIMKNFRRAVNRFLLLPEPAATAGSLAAIGSPASRAPASGARKSEILASRLAPCKRYFDEPINGA